EQELVRVPGNLLAPAADLDHVDAVECERRRAPSATVEVDCDPVDRASEPVAAHGGSADGVADVVGVEISGEPQRQDTLAQPALEVARHGRVPRRVVECARQRRAAGPAPDQLPGRLLAGTAGALL